MIVGPTGTGKSRSFKNIPPSLIDFCNFEIKALPFRPTSEWDAATRVGTKLTECNAAIDAAIASPKPLIGIDSVTQYQDYLQAFCENGFQNFEIWKQYNDRMMELFKKLNASGKVVILTALDEVVKLPTGIDEKEVPRRRAFTQGKEWAIKGFESMATAALFTIMKKEKPTDERPKHFFMTQSDGFTFGKSPEYWELPFLMENDLAIVLKKAGLLPASPTA
jgi:hypothetical protein